MKTNQNKSVLMGLLLCCWLLGGCEKEVIIPDLDGNLVGYLYTIDEFQHVLTDHSKVHITTRGIDGTYSAESDAGGRFEFKNLPAGTYDLTFEKEGFGKKVLAGVKHLGGQPTILGYNDNGRMFPLIRIVEIPKTLVQSIYFENDSLVADFNYSSESIPYSFDVFVFFSDQNGFAASDAAIRCFVFGRLSDGEYKAPFDKTLLNFESGQTVYFKAAVVSEYISGCIQMQQDGTFSSCTTNQNIFAPIGNVSEQFSFVFPD